MFNRTKPIADMDAWVEERLSEYLDGTLSPDERARVEMHLQKSERARASLEALRWTISLLKQTPAPSLPRQFTLPVTQRVPRSAPAWLTWSLRGVAVAASLAFVLLLGLTVLRQPNNAGVAEMQAPAAQSVQPTAVLAFQVTPVPNAQAAPRSQKGSAAPTPLMITVEPQPTSAPLPVNTTAETKQARPTQNKPATTNEALPPSPAPTNRPLNTAPVAPSSATPAVAGASSSGGNPPVATDGQESPTQVPPAQRSFVVSALEGTVNALQLKVREGPGLEYRSIGTLKFADKVQVVGRSQDNLWLVINYPKNRKTGQAWISFAFVTLNDVIDSLPVFEPPATETPEPSSTPGPLDETPTPSPTPDGSEGLMPGASQLAFVTAFVG